jgi:osmotically-inducible protein OsmY
MRANRHHLRPILVLAGRLIAIFIAGTPLSARAQNSTALMKRVESVLRSDRNLNGASCYTAAPGVIVLYGKVFDDKDRELAESKAGRVRGVKQVVNTLRTETGQWLEEEARINDTLVLDDFTDVSVRVIGSQAYLSGQVSSQAEVQRAIRVISSVSNLQVVNFMRVVPGPIFSTPSFL